MGGCDGASRRTTVLSWLVFATIRVNPPLLPKDETSFESKERRRYNAAADDFEAAEEALRLARVSQLTGERGDEGVEALVAQRDALVLKMEAARTVRFGETYLARITVPDRSVRRANKPPEDAAAAAAAAAPSKLLRNFLLAGTVALLLPLLALLAADPMQPPSPRLDAAAPPRVFFFSFERHTHRQPPPVPRAWRFRQVSSTLAS